MPGFRLTLFGPPELVAPDGRLVSFRTRKHLAVLVYLAVEARHRGVPRDRLVDLVWPDVEYRRGRHSLSQALTAIRAMLGRNAIGLWDKTLLLTAAVSTDFDRPAGIGGAVSDLPPPLEGLDRAGGVEFEQWVDRVRGRLVKTARRALTSEIEQLRQSGDTGAVHERAARLYRIDPRNETAVMLLTEHSLQRGDVTEGKGLLEEFLARAASGDDDYPTIRRLLGRLKSGAHDVLVDAPRPLTAEVNRQRVFVGRRDELRRLNASWTAARRGELTSCLVWGPAGIGKTALLRRFATSVASSGNLVLNAMCQHGAKDIPYATLSDLMEALSRDPELAATDPHWLSEASRVAPFLRDRYPGIPRPRGDLGDATRLTVAEAFVRMVEAVADSGPTLIVLDDVHNIDPASRDVMHILTRRMGERAVMLLASMRVAGVNAAEAASGETIDLAEWGTDIELPVLPADDARRLAKDLATELAHRSDYTDVIGKIPELTGGHPYFIEALVAEWRDHDQESLVTLTSSRSRLGEWHPPQSLRAVFSRHHRGLSQDARAILEVLAVAGRGLMSGELASLTGIPQRKTHKALVDGLARGIFVADGDAVTFKNEVHRAYVYNSCDNSTRVYRHACVANMLVESASRTDPSNLLAASHHFAQANLMDRAFEFAVAGAGVALSSGAPREAENALQPLLEKPGSTPRRFEAQVLLAESLGLQGNFRDALRWLSEMSVGECVDRALLARAAVLEAECLVRGRLASLDRLQTAARQAVKSARAAGTSALIGKALLVAAELAAESHDLGALSAVEEETARQISSADPAGSDGPALLARGFCLLSRGWYAEAWRCFKCSAQVSERHGDHGPLVRALNGAGTCAYAMGELKHATREYRKGMRLCEQMGDYVYASNLASNLGACLHEFGQYKDAEKLYSSALRFNGYVDDNRFETIILINVAAHWQVAGQLDRAMHYLQAAAQAAARSGLNSHAAMVLLGEADLLFTQFRITEAKDLVKRAEQLVPRHGDSTAPDLVHGFDSLAFTPLVLMRRLLDGEAEAIYKIDLTRLEGPMPLYTLISLHFLKETAAAQLKRAITHSPTADQMIAATGFWSLRVWSDRLKAMPFR